MATHRLDALRHQHSGSDKTLLAGFFLLALPASEAIVRGFLGRSWSYHFGLFQGGIMRRFCSGIGVVLLYTASVSWAASRWTVPVPADSGLDHLPREICRTVERSITYATDLVDVWSPAEHTWALGRGDCEDFAIAIQELCFASGIPTKLHVYFPTGSSREGHAILVGTWNGKLWYSSNGSYEEVGSEQEIRLRMARLLGCKESELSGMALSRRDVADYLMKAPQRSVAAAAPRAQRPGESD